ncbi:hypothetical protein Sango_0662000 [Sesamum angolense]|uniref:Tf2-1-like SH3-like domain-containing protein n=1 Tax=Sesamum angolense TaxID=2727404 RepID=A0AAE1X765_9LAMI|nr:hypothetical protein Sango_0662000 [Sesamum angolense]
MVHQSIKIEQQLKQRGPVQRASNWSKIGPWKNNPKKDTSSTSKFKKEDPKLGDKFAANKDYEDVFLEKIPPSLPPICEIEHQINFMPEASLPNRPAYRTNSEETKEIKKQIKEWMAKGCVRESLSPCAVLVLLVPKKDGRARNTSKSSPRGSKKGKVVWKPEKERVNMDVKKHPEFVKQIYENVKSTIEKMTQQYMNRVNKGRKSVIFEPGDLVWLHLRKERFLDKRNSKLMPRGNGLFRVLERINNNPYKLDLPDKYGVSASFNICDLSPFYDEDNEEFEDDSFSRGGG